MGRGCGCGWVVRRCPRRRRRPGRVDLPARVVAGRDPLFRLGQDRLAEPLPARRGFEGWLDPCEGSPARADGGGVRSAAVGVWHDNLRVRRPRADPVPVYAQRHLRGSHRSTRRRAFWTCSTSAERSACPSRQARRARRAGPRIIHPRRVDRPARHDVSRMCRRRQGVYGYTGRAVSCPRPEPIEFLSDDRLPVRTRSSIVRRTRTSSRRPTSSRLCWSRSTAAQRQWQFARSRTPVLDEQGFRGARRELRRQQRIRAAVPRATERALGRRQPERRGERGAAHGGYRACRPVPAHYPRRQRGPVHEPFARSRSATRSERAAATTASATLKSSCARRTSSSRATWTGSSVRTRPRADLYRDRSPIRFVDRVSCPVILLQGLEDRILPPDQAELMVRRTAPSGHPGGVLGVRGEGHGFRSSENIRRSLEAELAFYGWVLGFKPADELPPLQIENM